LGRGVLFLGFGYIFSFALLIMYKSVEVRQRLGVRAISYSLLIHEKSYSNSILDF
jgi:hypothetical protein